MGGGRVQKVFWFRSGGMGMRHQAGRLLPLPTSEIQMGDWTISKEINHKTKTLETADVQR